MRTSAPNPRWTDLARGLSGGVSGSPLSDPLAQALAKPWLRPDQSDPALFWTSRSAWSLSAMTDSEDTVWLPAHFCWGSAWPLVHEAKVTLRFYPVDHMARPDWEACRKMAQSHGGPSLFVLVHPFGLENDLAGAQAFCQETKALLVEDAAHALGPFGGIGSAGDLVLYSPHKLFGLPDGALVLAKPGLAAQRMKAGLKRLGSYAPAPWLWLAKRAAQKLGVKSSLPDQPFLHDPHPGGLAQTASISKAALAILGRVDMAGEAQARINNAQALAEGFASLPGWEPFFPASREPTPPYRLVMRCENPEIAERRYDAGRAAGLVVESWPDMPPAQLAGDEGNEEALKLRQTLLLFPCDSAQPAQVRAEAYGAALRGT